MLDLRRVLRTFYINSALLISEAAATSSNSRRREQLSRGGVSHFDFLPEHVKQAYQFADVGNIVPTHVPVLFGKHRRLDENQPNQFTMGIKRRHCLVRRDGTAS
jgi:hypothetical protein